jgi:inner membrane protein
MGNQTPSFLERNAALLKGFFIGFLSLILLIPTFMVQSIISDREQQKAIATKEVGSKWANNQTLIGPILRIPYYEVIKVEKTNLSGKKETEQTKQLAYAYFLPEKLKISTQVMPEKRNRGIYEVVVYQSKSSFQGEFSDLVFTQPNISSENIMWKDAAILLTINDFRGIDEEVKLNWNTKPSLFNTGANLPIEGENMQDKACIHAPIVVENEGKGKNVFQFNVVLKGSESLAFTPVGKTSEVEMQSSWKNPSFDGAFLPDQRTIDANGFRASWKVLHLNRNFPQQWDKVAPASLVETNFGVKLFTPNDVYQQSNRSVKYAILIIALTFMSFFFIEILNHKRIHPLNYILIGLGLCIFYTLLVSISEFLNFNQAYFIATALTLALVFLYAKSILQSSRLATIVGGVMLILYSFIFIIIQLEDTALLIGSIGLFLILAIVMYVSRKINWASAGLKEE